MRFLKKKQNIYGMIMLVFIVISAVMLRINNSITKIIGLCLFPLVIIFGICLLKVDNRR